MSEPLRSGEERDMPAEQYHAITDHVSNSMLGDFLQSPEYYHARYVAKTIPPKEPTPAMQFGTLFHDAVLLGIDHVAVLIPDEVLSSNGAKTGKGWEFFKQQYEGMNKVFLKKAEFRALDEMATAVWNHPVAGKLLSRDGTSIEKNIFWHDDVTGMRLKARLDHRRHAPPVITDLKTTSDASRKGFAKTVYDFGYHRQAVMYKNAAKALTGEDHAFIFVVVSKEPPHTVACYDLTQRALTQGYEDMRAGLDMLDEAYETDNWHSPGWSQVLTIDMPNWAYSNEWETVDGYGD